MTEPDHGVERFSVDARGQLQPDPLGPLVHYSAWEQVRDERDQGARYVEGWQEATKEAEAERDQAKAQALAEVREALIGENSVLAWQGRGLNVIPETFEEILSTLEGPQCKTSKAESPVYFFGCLKGTYGEREEGHYFYSEGPAHERAAPRKGPWLGGGILPPELCKKIDGGLCPHYARERRYAKAQLVHHAGWTVLAMWDSSGDTRPGSDSNFFMLGVLPFKDALAEARRAFPEVIERIENKYGEIELVSTVSTLEHAEGR